MQGSIVLSDVLKKTLHEIDTIENDSLSDLKKAVKLSLDKIKNKEELEKVDLEVLDRTMKRFADKLDYLQKNSISMMKDVIKTNIESDSCEKNTLLTKAILKSKSGMDIIARITELTSKLRETDHIVVEILEFEVMGDDPPYDINVAYKQRQEWRSEIEQLSQQFYNDHIDVNSILYTVEEEAK